MDRRAGGHQGTVLLDQSMLTGVSLPAEVGPGETAYGSALVRRGEATVETIATGTRTFSGRAAELVRVAHAQSSEEKTVLGVVRNLSAINAGIVIALIGYAYFIAMPIGQLIPLVLTAILSAVPIALPATFSAKRSRPSRAACAMFRSLLIVLPKEQRVAGNTELEAAVDFARACEVKVGAERGKGRDHERRWIGFDSVINVGVRKELP
jgi:hypothetical protein